MIKVTLTPDDKGFKTDIWINEDEVRVVSPVYDKGTPMVGQSMVYIPGVPSPMRVDESPLSLVTRIEDAKRSPNWMRLAPGPQH